jgi:hypothetical protein
VSFKCCRKSCVLAENICLQEPVDRKENIFSTSGWWTPIILWFYVCSQKLWFEDFCNDTFSIDRNNPTLNYNYRAFKKELYTSSCADFLLWNKMVQLYKWQKINEFVEIHMSVILFDYLWYYYILLYSVLIIDWIFPKFYT